MTTLTWDLEAYLSAAWVSIKNDVRTSQKVTAEKGFFANAPDDRIAATGSLSFALDNSADNTGKKLGYYSPGHVDCRTGWDLGTKLRLKIDDGTTTKYQLLSKVKRIQPAAGKYGNREVQVLAVDYFEDMGANTLQQIPVQTTKRVDQAITTAVAGMTNAPSNVSYATGPETYTRLLFGLQDGKSYTLTALQQLCQTDKSYLFLKGDLTHGETLTWQSRHTRNTATIAAVLNDRMHDLQIERSSDYLLNDITTTCHPCVVDTTVKTLYTLTREIALKPGANDAIVFQFTDPSGAGRRTDMVYGSQPPGYPVSGTDYRFSAAAGGTGNDLAANLSAAVTWGGNSCSIIFTNSYAATGYLNLFLVRGYGIYDYAAVDKNSTDAASKTLYNRRAFHYDLPYQDSVNIAKDFASAVLAERKAPGSYIKSVSFHAHATQTLAGYAANCDIGDCVTITETVTGISGNYYIGSVKWECGAKDQVDVTWGNLEPASLTTPFRISGPVNTYSLLDGTDVLTF